MGKAHEINCLEVIRELSQYLDEDVSPDLRNKIQKHLAHCTHCTAIYDGLRNVVSLVGDRRMFELPVGFSQRLRAKLSKSFV